MKHFTDSEFHGMSDKVEPDVLNGLDELREQLGVPIHLTSDPEGICRHSGPNSRSDHNIDVRSKTRAVDGYIPDSLTYKQFYVAAIQAGFNTIGLYTGWKSGRRGFHLGIRPGLLYGEVARWSGIWNEATKSHEYKGISALLNKTTGDT